MRRPPALATICATAPPSDVGRAGRPWIEFHLDRSDPAHPAGPTPVRRVGASWLGGRAIEFADRRVADGPGRLAAALKLLDLRGSGATLGGRDAPRAERELARRLYRLWYDSERVRRKVKWVADLLADHPAARRPKAGVDDYPLAALLERGGSADEPAFSLRDDGDAVPADAVPVDAVPVDAVPAVAVRFTVGDAPADRAAVADLLARRWGLHADPADGDRGDDDRGDPEPADPAAPASAPAPAPPPARRVFPLVEHVQFCGVYSLEVAGAAGGDRVDHRRVVDPRDGHPLDLLPAEWVGGRPVVRVAFDHASGGRWYAVLGLGFDPDSCGWATLDLTAYRRLVVVARAANGADDLHAALDRCLALRLRLEDVTSDGVNGRHQSTGWTRPRGLTNRPAEHAFDLAADLDWSAGAYPESNTAAPDRSRVLQLTLGHDPDDPPCRGLIELAEVRLEA